MDNLVTVVTLAFAGTFIFASSFLFFRKKRIENYIQENQALSPEEKEITEFVKEKVKASYQLPPEHYLVIDLPNEATGEATIKVSVQEKPYLRKNSPLIQYDPGEIQCEMITQKEGENYISKAQLKDSLYFFSKDTSMRQTFFTVLEKQEKVHKRNSWIQQTLRSFEEEGPVELHDIEKVKEFYENSVFFAVNTDSIKFDKEKGVFSYDCITYLFDSSVEEGIRLLNTYEGQQTTLGEILPEMKREVIDSFSQGIF